MTLHRLQSVKDFRLLFRFGRKKESRFFQLTVLQNNLLFSRFAFITPKSIDKRAVMRNRLRRRAREWVRMHASCPLSSADIAVFLKKDAKQATKKEFYEDLATIFQPYTKK